MHHVSIKTPIIASYDVLSVYCAVCYAACAGFKINTKHCSHINKYFLYANLLFYKRLIEYLVNNLKYFNLKLAIFFLCAIFVSYRSG